jgi:manganese transport protein
MRKLFKNMFEANSGGTTATVDIPQGKNGFWKKLFAFMGPAYLISVGYMDPGNWATDISGGSAYGYKLLWVLLVSNLIALVMQNLSARLGIVKGKDLAQVSRQYYHPVANFLLWLLAEIAIASCDLAEVLGMAIGLNLLFGLPILIGIVVTILDTFLLLTLQRYGMRKMETFIIGLIAIIGVSYLMELFWAAPVGSEFFKGFVPSFPDSGALYVAIGIIGATVMPHNLYLHSSLVQTRKYAHTEHGIKQAIRFNFIDTFIALNIAFFVNVAILVLAAAAFYKAGYFQVTDIQDAYKLLYPILGHKIAPILFAIALIAAGQSSTLTGTLAGQVVMEGYLNIRIQPWLRRFITRSIAIIPAFFTVYFLGDQATGKLLVLSQVILSMQLVFAMIPLVYFVADKKLMGDFKAKTYVLIAAWVCIIVILGLNMQWLWGVFKDFYGNPQNIFANIGVSLGILLVVGLTVYVLLTPLISRRKRYTQQIHVPHLSALSLRLEEDKNAYKKIAITVDFSPSDVTAISKAIGEGGKEATYMLIHIVETAGARFMQEEIRDFETSSDKKNLDNYVVSLEKEGYKAMPAIGYGSPKLSIAKIVNESDAELLVMGVHGHKTLKDIIFGTTIDKLRHLVHIPMLIVRK